MFLDRFADRGDDLGIRFDQIVAAHAGLAGDAGGHDDDVGAGGVERIVEIALDREEKAAFDKSVAAVRELIGVVNNMKILG